MRYRIRLDINLWFSPAPAKSMGMLMRTDLMFRMVMVMSAVLARMAVVMSLGGLAMFVLVRMLMQMLVGMSMGVFMAVRLFVVAVM